MVRSQSVDTLVAGGACRLRAHLQEDRRSARPPARAWVPLTGAVRRPAPPPPPPLPLHLFLLVLHDSPYTLKVSLKEIESPFFTGATR